MIESASLSHQGLVRHQNEDSIVDDAALGLWIVADGVGGNGCGDVASQIASQTLQRKVRQGEGLVRATLSANSAIIEAAAQRVEYRQMATTVVACHVQGSAYEIAWVGDSRAYLIDRQQISQLTSDHNAANILVEQGVLTHEEAQHHPGQHELTQALGQMNLKAPSVSLGELHHGEYLLLCTDGLTGVLSDAEIRQIVWATASLQDACQKLLDAVLAKGAPDNVSVILLHYHDEPLITQASDFGETSRESEDGMSRTWLVVMIIIGIILLGWAI